ncbi:hypothetical protein FA13DRAFT_195214 [Coprinellus micaceus]|uniref:Uncharacterized protein n=1 Tax=Coprinellus micaceus TaxID=71717 RepID=A0A4Y7TIA4_COPMI|nr:hypothetical protein FA13DRAFT_195214 [Coprinellus micaceus]
MLAMESRRSSLFSCLFLFALLLSSPLAVLGSPLLTRQSSSLSKRIAEALSIDVAFLERRDVVVPKIISPTASSVWPVGSTQTVTWDTSDFPPYNQITNKLGRVILGRDTGDSLNLDIDHPLAQGFNITNGKVDIVVPNVPPRNDYLIVLMGDSGNTSPSFAITAISAGPGSTTSSSATSSTPSAAPTSTRPPTSSTPAVPETPTSTTVSDSVPTTAGEALVGDPSTTSTSSETPATTNTTPESSSTSTSQQVLGNSAMGIRSGRWMTVFGVVVAGILI